MREARRQNRHTRPALTKHTPIAHQRQTPAAAGAKNALSRRPYHAKRLARRDRSPGTSVKKEVMTPVILSRQQLDQLWEIDRSEIIDTLYRLDNGQLRAYREYYDVRGWDPHDRQVYTPIHEACYDRGGIFRLFDDEQMIAAAALDTLPRGMNGELRQLLFFYVGAGKRGRAGAATV